MNWRQNPARVAWLVLLVSFTACIFLAVALPVAARATLLHSTRAKFAFVESLRGTVQLWSPSGEDAAAVTGRRPVTQRSRIVTDASSKGVLTLSVDEAGQLPLATVQLSPSTSLVLQEARSPRFNLSRDPHRAVLEFASGRLFVTIQQADERDAQMRIATPSGEVDLGPGIFDITANEQETRVRVRSGLATAHGAGRAVDVNPGERVSVTQGRPPEFPVSDTVNLIVNGSFENQLAPLWQENAEVKPGYTPGRVELVQDDRRSALRFSRRTEEQVPNRVWVSQTVDRDVDGYDTLALRLDVKVLYQSVPGGGEQDSEYPLMVDLAYTDIYGKDLHHYVGFYAFDLPPGSPYPKPSGERVPLGVWYTYESPNLFELLGETRPARINSLTIYANGHDYESLVSDVALTVQ
jgi:hypothetical protein